MVVYITGSILLGVFFRKIIEDPFLKLRDKFYPSKVAANEGFGTKKQAENKFEI
jgi:hypothetical protein